MSRCEEVSGGVERGFSTYRADGKSLIIRGLPPIWQEQHQDKRKWRESATDKSQSNYGRVGKKVELGRSGTRPGCEPRPGTGTPDREPGELDPARAEAREGTTAAAAEDDYPRLGQLGRR